jgi:hypothetical protein
MDDIEKRINTKPTGGFPPIRICEKDDIKKDDDIKTRGFAKDEKNVVASLREIMEERRSSKDPFIAL